MSVIARNSYQQTRIRLIRRGTTLRRWALDNHLPLGTVYNAVKCTRNGVTATRIRQQLERYLNE
jgi:hypothetical protein